MQQQLQFSRVELLQVLEWEHRMEARDQRVRLQRRLPPRRGR